MKTRLLKKVRRRYEIIKIITPPNVDCLIRDWWQTYNRPFYIIKDEEDSWRTWCSDDKNKLMETLKEWILSDYGHNRKSYRIGKREKIWHNQ